MTNNHNDPAAGTTMLPVDTPARRRAAIALLNDTFRQHLGLAGGPGRTVMTRALAALPATAQADILHAVRMFADFTPGNDPYGEHDFGALDAGGERINFKIDYYEDAEMEFGAEDPRTCYRVLTIMLASDY